MYFYNIRYVFHNAIFTNVPYTTASKYSEEIPVRDWEFTSGFGGTNLFWAHALINKKSEKPVRFGCFYHFLKFSQEVGFALRPSGQIGSISHVLQNIRYLR